LAELTEKLLAVAVLFAEEDQPFDHDRDRHDGADQQPEHRGSAAN
jgi:hypothetical protein